ncbi:MAG: phosphoribosylamine--glycine ligase [Candidatus Diapherotrites archaeon]|nr:phosphoribosylamine--glycine ligase [Candidatus Diapherotrites archaeon]
MRALLVGNGAREHSIAEALARDSDVYAFMKAKNPGIARIAKEHTLGDLNDNSAIASFAEEVNPDFVIVGPENPLANGVTDVLEEKGFKVVGPDKQLAKLESDKSFTREFMKRQNVFGAPDFQVCRSYDEAVDAIDRIQNVVVKAAGLVGGKGVKVLGDQLKSLDEAKAYAKDVLDCKIGPIPRVVIEEKLEGEEFSLQAFVDGKHVIPMPLAQDHKRAYDDDKGPMTGGMGSYSDSDHLLPFVTEEDRAKALRIMQETVEALYKETWKYYKGVLYGGFMLTADGPRLLEYNVRFGDPEAMNVLPIMENPLTEVCQQIVDGTLTSVDFQEKATVCKYVVPKGYPTSPVGGAKIEVTPVEGVRTYYSSVDEREDGLYMTSSRAVAFLGIADMIEEAEKQARRALSGVSGPVFYRDDIGTRELIQKRIEHMQKLRSAGTAAQQATDSTPSETKSVSQQPTSKINTEEL